MSAPTVETRTVRIATRITRRLMGALWPAGLENAGVPPPRWQCDGSLRVPYFNPETRAWESLEWRLSRPCSGPAMIVPRAACGDPECIARHAEDFTAAELAQARRVA